MDSITGGHIPFLKTFAHESHSRPCQPSSLPLAEVRLILVPDVPHGGIDVGEVVGPLGNAHPFGHTMTRAEDQVVAGQIERFDRKWKDWQVIPIVGCRKRQSLNETRSNRMLLYDMGN